VDKFKKKNRLFSV